MFNIVDDQFLSSISGSVLRPMVNIKAVLGLNESMYILNGVRYNKSSVSCNPEWLHNKTQ